MARAMDRCPASRLRAAGAACVIAGVALAGAAPRAAAQGEGMERQHWDWGQHRTGLVESVAEPPPASALPQDHWDYPGAPVRFAGGTLAG